MSSKDERRAAHDTVRAYHREQLGLLVEHVAAATRAHQAGSLDAFQVDEIIFQYSRAAKELWKFCNVTDVQVAALIIADGPDQDWWQHGAPRSRR